VKLTKAERLNSNLPEQQAQVATTTAGFDVLAAERYHHATFVLKQTDWPICFISPPLADRLSRGTFANEMWQAFILIDVCVCSEKRKKGQSLDACGCLWVLVDSCGCAGALAQVNIYSVI
jgi:hypothetical protein